MRTTRTHPSPAPNRRRPRSVRLHASLVLLIRLALTLGAAALLAACSGQEDLFQDLQETVEESEDEEGSGESEEESDGGDGTGEDAVPAAPTNLSAAATAPDTVELSWTDNADNETGFEIQRKPQVQESFNTVTTTETDTTKYEDSGLTAETTYDYRLRAVNDAGSSDWTAEATTTTPSTDAPATPSVDGISEGTYAEAQTFTLSGIEEGATAGYSIDGGTTWNEYAGEVTIDQEGAYNITARQTDDDGTLSPSSSPISVLIFIPPSGLSATAQHDNLIELTWTDESEIEDDYEIERSPNGSDSWTPITTERMGPTIRQDIGLDSDTQYFYRVRGLTSSGTPSAWSNSASAQTPQLSAPTNLQVQSVSESEIDLSWSDNSWGESTFQIERNGAIIGEAQIDAQSYSDTELNPDTTYSYRVRAADAGGASPWTASETATTDPPPQEPPAAPSGLGATPDSGSQITLSWTDNSENESGFEVQRKTGSDGTFTGIATPGPDSTGYLDSGLDSETTYVYRVRAVNSAGASAWSSEAFTTTLDVTPPPAPDIVGLTDGATYTEDVSFTLSNLESGASVEYSTDGGTNWSAYSGSVTLSDHGSYQVTARQTDEAGNTSSDAATVTVNIDKRPAAPNALDATAASSSAVDLSWSDNSDNETGFEIERKPSGGTFSSVATTSADAVSAQDADGLNPSTSYVYRIRAVNENGASDWSAEASATTDPVFHVTYDGNGASSGQVPTDDTGYEESDTVQVSGNTGGLAKIDHTFAGWNTQSDGTGSSYSGGDTFSMPAADVTLYAVWNPDYTITIDFQNPDDPSITFDWSGDDVTQGTTVEVTASTGFAGYTWYLNGSSGHAALSASGSSVTIDTSGLAFGTHTVSLVVDEGYSAEFSFDVVNETSGN